MKYGKTIVIFGGLAVVAAVVTYIYSGIVMDRAAEALFGTSLSSCLHLRSVSKNLGQYSTILAIIGVVAILTGAAFWMFGKSKSRPKRMQTNVPAPVELAPTQATAILETVYCGQCGAKAKEGFVFCWKCGKPLSSPNP